MIKPTNISSEGWDWYESMQIDWYLYECHQAGEFEEHYNYNEYFDHMVMPYMDIRCSLDNDTIFHALQEKGEWFGHFYYDLDSQYYDECEAGWFDPCTQLSWEEEYEMFCDSEASVYLNYKDCVHERQVQQTLHKASTWSRKKRKHLRDKKYFFRDVKRKQCKVEYIEWSYGEHVCFKHKRAEKVYVEEEYNEDKYEYYDDTFDYPYDEEYEDWFLNEIGLPHYTSDFDWRKYSVCKPPAGCSVEVKDYNTCAYCGNKHQHCNCFE
ncbi:MAG: hypothetical protein GY928_23280 [Colwellia sp.]|nr:hypothetical protein [Colwellia sp.]